MVSGAVKQVNNGVNVEALLGARAALTDAPEGAKFNWKATCNWVNGTHSRSRIREFFGLGDQQKHRTEFSFEADHPEVFASEDKGVTPVEYVLVGLASSLTAGIAAVAQNRGIQLRSVAASIEGSMDIQGILGIDSDVRNGFDGVKVKYTIDADATPDEIRALVAQSQKRSAVYDIIRSELRISSSGCVFHPPSPPCGRTSPVNGGGKRHCACVFLPRLRGRWRTAHAARRRGGVTRIAFFRR